MVTNVNIVLENNSVTVNDTHNNSNAVKEKVFKEKNNFYAKK